MRTPRQALIKYNEAQSIRRTYEQIVKRLKEERVGFDNQLAAIERTLQAKEKDLEELVLMSHDAHHSKEVAKAELASVDMELQADRLKRERELTAHRQQVCPYGTTSPRGGSPLGPACNWECLIRRVFPI